MTGQGSPSLLPSVAKCAARRRQRVCRGCARRPAIPRRSIWLAAGVLIVHSLSGPTLLAAPNGPNEHEVRLRIAWGGEHANAWSGSITLNEGEFSDLQLIGLEADAPGSIWIEGNVIRVDSIRPRRFDGIDVTAKGGAAARLSIDMRAGPEGPPATASVALTEIEAGAIRHPLDQAGSALVIHRVAGDAVRIETDRDSLIFAPGEEFSFTVRATLPELEPNTTIDVVTKLSRARQNEQLWDDEQRLPVPVNEAPSANVRIPLPFEEGVYNVRISASRPPGFGDRFLPGAKHESLAERTFQVVVLKLAAETVASEPRREIVLEIDPANPRWWQRLPAWTQLQRIPGFFPRPLGSLRAGAVDHPLGRFVELPPTLAGDEPHWQAYPLPIEQTGVPHWLEVNYPADREQHLGLSILEANSAGRIVPIGRDTGVYVEGFGRFEQQEPHTHRYVFWPRTNSPMLLVTNAHPTASALFGQIRVTRGDGKLTGPEHRRAWHHSERLVAAYIAKPLVPEQFGATEGVHPTSGQSIDDWQTFYECARRLSEYLSYAGYNAAVVNVLADGSSIYPSRELNCTPLYDTGRMNAGGIDLPANDALDLMLRMFDREGLALVPSLQLAAPLPALERLRRAAGPQSSGLEWIGADGRTWLETHGTVQGLAPYYNLLDERVQLALLNVVREIIDRYGHHEALAGLAVQLSGNGYAQLPGVDWGFDDATIEQFQLDTGVPMVGGGPNRFAARHAALTGEHADAWRAWRAARVSQFYERLAELVQSSGSNRRLLLTTEDMFVTPAVKTHSRPNVLNKMHLERSMLDVGIDALRLQQTAGIVVCPAQFVEPMSPLVDRAIDLELNEAVSVSRRENSNGIASQAAMFFHRPQRTRMASFDAKNELNSYTLLVTQSSADASLVRRRFAQALAQADPAIFLDGGELIPMGQEEATRDVLRAIQQLPTVVGEVHRQQPVTLRKYDTAEGTTCLVVNESPWSVDATIALDVSRGVTLAPLVVAPKDVAAGDAKREFTAGQQRWSLRLLPYDVQAARLTGGEVKIGAIKATVSAGASSELERLVSNLESRDLTAPSTYKVLANPGFEPLGGGSALPGWEIVEGAADITAELDATMPHSGKTCLYFQCRGPRAAVASSSFATPPTGQMYFLVWARGENLSPQTELRLVLETDGDTQPYRRFAVVGGDAPDSLPLKNEWQRRPYGFYLTDVPLVSRGTMRVKFELVGPGEVWIDDVQLYDLLFPMGKIWYEPSEKEKLAFVKTLSEIKRAYESGRYSDCVELLESYWPRFLLAYTPPVPQTQPVIANEPARRDPQAAAAAPAPTPAAADEKAPAVSGWRRLWSFVR